MPSAQGKTTVAVSTGLYHGETGVGIGISHRLDFAVPTVIFGNYSNAAGSNISGARGWPLSSDSARSTRMLRLNNAATSRFSMALRCAALAAVIATSWPGTARAQQQPAQSVPQQFQESADWGKLPKMVLERQFAGPLQDTVIQRLRDPVDGTVCYLYLPISAPHSPTTATGFVQYGPNMIGSMNCQPPAIPQRVPSAPAQVRKP
jgi:hypothetical protein